MRVIKCRNQDPFLHSLLAIIVDVRYHEEGSTITDHHHISAVMESVLLIHSLFDPTKFPDVLKGAWCEYIE
jgi:hypothetical protein